MKISAISQTNFTSKVVYEKSAPHRPLTTAEKNFIDRFDEGDLNGTKFLGEGVTAKAYYVPEHNFVIKQNHDNPFVPYKSRGEVGSLAYENDMLLSIDPHVEHTQYGIAYAETQKGGEYLISTFVEGKPADVIKNPITPKRMDRLLRTMYRLDKSGIIQPDLSRPNVLYDDYNYANIIDYQYAGKIDFNKQYRNYGLETADFPSFEAPNNAELFEGSGLTGYLKDMSPSEAENFLHDYLQNKAYYTEKWIKRLSSPTLANTEREKLLAFESASDDVLKAEILKMNLLNCQRRQFTCYDPNVVSERNILRCIPLMIRAMDSAKALAGFQPSRSTNKNGYFAYMRKLGEFWAGKFSEWYPNTLTNWILKLMTRDKVSNNKIMFPAKFGDFTKIDTLKTPHSIYIEHLHSEEDFKLRNIFRQAYKDEYVSLSTRREVENLVRKLFR